MDHDWRYALLSDTDDAAELDRRVRGGDGWVALVRTAPSAVQLLHPEGSWQDTNRLSAIAQHAAMEWTTDLNHGRAREIVTEWVAGGRLRRQPDIERQVPAELARLIDERAGAAATALQAEQALSRAEVRSFTRTVLDGRDDLSERWLAVGGRAVGLAPWPADLSDTPALARIYRALTATGADTVWALDLTPHGPLRRLAGGVRAPLSEPSLRALSQLYGTLRSLALSTPALDCVVLQTDDYGVVAGSLEFVETVLGEPLAAARERFLAYAGQRLGREASTLRRAARRHPPVDATAGPAMRGSR